MGIDTAIKIAMIATTISISTKVKPPFFRSFSFRFFMKIYSFSPGGLGRRCIFGSANRWDFLFPSPLPCGGLLLCQGPGWRGLGTAFFTHRGAAR